MRTRSRMCLLLLLCFVSSNISVEAAIEAVRGKEYRLTKQHGPWMIMVASFRNVPEERRTDGLTAEEASAALVYELRTIGIPAYVYRQDAVIERVNTTDRLGREDKRIFAAQRDMISVIAGNYKSIDDRTGQQTLDYIKKYQPKFLSEGKNGGIYRQTPGRKSALAGAFLTINPLLNPNDVTSGTPDPVLVELNKNVENSLIDAPGKYSLVVATMSLGKSVTSIGPQNFADLSAAQRISRDEAQDLGKRWGEVSDRAWMLCQVLRQRGIEAYTYHDRYHSVVTVGSFDNPNDPKIAEYRQMFSAKYKEDPSSGKTVFVSEVLAVPGRSQTDPPYMTWIFDPYPKVIETPRL